MAKALPKINDIEKTPMKEVLGDDAAPKKRRGRPKKFQTLAEVEADINLREYQKLKKKFDKLKASKKAKITPAKLSPAFYALDAGLKLEEENKVQTEKITKLITIQKTLNLLIFYVFCSISWPRLSIRGNGKTIL